MSTLSNIITHTIKNNKELLSSYTEILETENIEDATKLDTIVLCFKQSILFGMTRVYNKIINLSNATEPYSINELLSSVFPVVKICNSYHSLLLKLGTIELEIRPEIDFLESMLQALYHSIRIVLPSGNDRNDRDIFKEVVHIIESKKNW